MLHNSIGLRTLALISVLATPTSAFSQGASPQKRFVGAPDIYCTHQPFSGSYRVQTPYAGGSNDGKWNFPDEVVRQILFPIVQYPKSQHAWTTYPVQIPANTQVTVEACGCVQTGGTGRTWKRYVDPQGANADRLYHGAIWIPGAASMGLRRSSILGGDFVRLQDLINWERAGNRWQTTKALSLVLGYEDDDTSDNGYWGHDDGTQDQCRGLYAAAVSIFLQAK